MVLIPDGRESPTFRPFLFTVEREGGARFSSLAAIRLSACYRPPATEPLALLLARERQTKFLQTAPLRDTEHTFQWRFLFRPHRQVEIALLSRARARSVESASAASADLHRQLLQQLNLLEQYFEFSSVRRNSSFHLLFEPFPLRFVAEFRRPDARSNDELPNLEGAFPAESLNDDWIRLCASFPDPLMLTMTFSPVSLPRRLTRFLLNADLPVSAIYGFSPVGDGQDDSHLSNHNNGKKESISPRVLCAQMHVTSHRCIPAVFLETLSHELAGSLRDATGRLHTGRYLWQEITDPEKRAVALNTVQWQEPSSEGRGKLSPNLALVHCFTGSQLGIFARLPITLGPTETHLLPVRPFPRVCIGEQARAGIRIGLHISVGRRITVRIPTSTRMLPTAILGGSGTGKTTLMENMILQDIAKNRGMGILDPHGDLALRILNKIPDHRWNDVIYLDFSDFDYPVGLNVFDEKSAGLQAAPKSERAIHQFVGMLMKLYPPDMIGPICQQNLMNALKLMQWNPDRPATLADLPRCFVDRAFRRCLVDHCQDPFVRQFWREIDAQSSASFKGESLQYIVSKLTPFLDYSPMRNILGQWHSPWDLHRWIEEGRILIVNLAKGALGERNCSLLGMILLQRIEQIALRRPLGNAQPAREWMLYLDEFHNLATEHFSQMLSELRKFRVGMVVATQCLSHLDERMREAVLANVGTLVSFRISPRDAACVEAFLSPHVDSRLLCRLPNYEALVRVASEQEIGLFNVQTLPVNARGLSRSQEALTALARKFASPRAEVEQEIYAAFNASKST